MKDALGHGSAGSGIHSQGVKATPQLQRRHFEEIAAKLRAAPDAGSPAHAQRVEAMATQLSTTNPGFRRDFFTAAATPGGAYRNKGPGNNPSAVAKKAAKFTNFSGYSGPGAQSPRAR